MLCWSQNTIFGKTFRRSASSSVGQFFLLEACLGSGTGWSTAGSPANAKLTLPIVIHHHSTIACCSSAQTPCLIHEHSSGSERVDALGLRAVEVIICMITRDFSVISIDVTGISLSLSLSLPPTKVTHAQYRKRFRASYNEGKMMKALLGKRKEIFEKKKEKLRGRIVSRPMVSSSQSLIE